MALPCFLKQVFPWQCNFHHCPSIFEQRLDEQCDLSPEPSGSNEVFISCIPVFVYKLGQRASQKCSWAPAVAPCSASSIDMKFKLKMVASVKIINEATKILHPLRYDVENSFLFENEVEENLMRLFQKHRNSIEIAEYEIRSLKLG